MADEKLAVRTADLIERRILDNGWPVDTLIGSEAQLLEEFGVSRAVLREAVLLLEQRQIASRRRGVGGGVLVRRPELSSVARSVSLFLECDGVSPAQLMEARVLFEQHCAVQLIRVGTPDERDRLLAHARAGLGLGGEAGRDHMGKFHLLLARLSGNPVWTMFVQVLTQVAIDLGARANEGPTDDDLQLQFMRLVAIAEAIVACDEGTASESLRAYIEYVTERFAQKQA